MTSALTRFEAALRSHRHDLDELIAYRSLPPERGRRLTEGVGEFRHALQHDFPHRTAMILYSRDADSLDVFALSGAGLAHERIDGAAEKVHTESEHLLDCMGVRAAQATRLPIRRDIARKTRPASEKPDPEPVGAVLSRLSHTLLPGDVARLIAMDGIEHIVIVPTGNLGTIPYSMLEVPDLGQLVDRVSITVAPSAGDILRYCRIRQHISDPLVVGNPDFADPEYELTTLPGAEYEAAEIAKLVSTTAVTGASATKPKIVQAGKHADLIYLATHGVANEVNPLDDSFLALSLARDASPRWTAREIQHETLMAELVVLSACQTGLGGSLDGGIVGLARAFQLAGARQVIMTLWSIDDLRSAEIMCDIMTHYLSGKTAPSSVRHGMAAAKAKGVPPSVWAPFTTFAGQFGLESGRAFRR